jgi:hypothetical protein
MEVFYIQISPKGKREEEQMQLFIPCLLNKKEASQRLASFLCGKIITSRKRSCPKARR